MTSCLPPNLLALFAPRDPIRYLAPINKAPEDKKRDSYGLLAPFVKYFEDPKDTPPPKKLNLEMNGENEFDLDDPQDNKKSTSDPFKTLFVARMNYDTSESKLRREFEVYGPIRAIKLITDTNGKPKGYAFIEYEHERDMRTAYKHADGKKIDSYRVLVDVERARTVEGWLPRRLGGGLGNTRKAQLPKDKRGYDDERMRRDREERRERRRSRSRDRDRDRERRRRRSRSIDDDRPRRRSRDREERRKERRHRSRSPDRKRKREDRR